MKGSSNAGEESLAVYARPEKKLSEEEALIGAKIKALLNQQPRAEKECFPCFFSNSSESREVDSLIQRLGKILDENSLDQLIEIMSDSDFSNKVLEARPGLKTLLEELLEIFLGLYEKKPVSPSVGLERLYFVGPEYLSDIQKIELFLGRLKQEFIAPGGDHLRWINALIRDIDSIDSMKSIDRMKEVKNKILAAIISKQYIDLCKKSGVIFKDKMEKIIKDAGIKLTLKEINRMLMCKSENISCDDHPPEKGMTLEQRIRAQGGGKLGPEPEPELEPDMRHTR